MAVVRSNIVTNSVARDLFIRGAQLLKAEDSGQTTTSLGIPGPSQSIRTYDLFVVWHHVAMMRMTPPGSLNPNDRNSAHRGPSFLPWHRLMLMVLEQNLQRVLGDDTFGLPYWDWSADGNLTAGGQPAAPVWAANCMGGSGLPVSTGPFAFNSADPNAWRVRIRANIFGNLVQANSGLRRQLGADIPTLPTPVHVSDALALATYDAPEWDVTSPGFRNRVEGWTSGGPLEPWLHNRVHVWVGGDMSPSSSPNDPVFYLNHCNEDRIWEKWLVTHGRSYVPPPTASPNLLGHRLTDPLDSPFGASATPQDLLDVSAIYSYDVLP